MSKSEGHTPPVFYVSQYGDGSQAETDLYNVQLEGAGYCVIENVDVDLAGKVCDALNALRFAEREARAEVERLKDEAVDRGRYVHSLTTEKELLEDELAAFTKWDDPIEYLYDQKPEECLYRRGDEDDDFGGLTFKHGDHLTRENLRGKWEIARELAYRDARIARLENALRNAEYALAHLHQDNFSVESIRAGIARELAEESNGELA